MGIQSIGVRELRDGATKVLRSVREAQAEYVITVHGQPVAVIRPIQPEDEARLRRAEIEAHMAELDALAEAVDEAWTSPHSAVELVEQQRRG